MELAALLAEFLDVMNIVTEYIQGLPGFDKTSLASRSWSLPSTAVYLSPLGRLD